MYAYNRVAATDQYLLETIRVLSAIPEETGMLAVGHADRVAELSFGVARELGLSPEDASRCSSPLTCTTSVLSPSTAWPPSRDS